MILIGNKQIGIYNMAVILIVSTGGGKPTQVSKTRCARALRSLTFYSQAIMEANEQNTSPVK